jgi:predicted permease
MLESVRRDLRLAARMLAKNPGFACIAILSIAIGVGADAAMFSVADGLILRPLPVPRPGTLITVSATSPAGEILPGGVSYSDYLDLRARAQSFDGLVASRGIVATFGGRPNEPAQSRFGLAVSANLFDVLEVAPALGRTFVAEEDRVPVRDAVVILAHELWTEQFASNPAVIGQAIRLGGEAFTIVGVTRAGFTGLDIYLRPAFYVPLAVWPRLEPGGQADLLERRDARMFRVMGRLHPDVPLAQARQEVQIIAAALADTYPDTNRNWGLLVRTEMRARMAQFAPAAAFAAMLAALAIAVLLVACANVAGLLASRAPGRARELALRLAIGGSRVRLVRQLVTESLMMAIGGGVIGLAIAYGGIRSFQQLQIPSEVGVRLVYELDRRAFLVGIAIAAISALVSSVLPAWRATRTGDLVGTLQGTTVVLAQRSRLWGRSGLVIAQVALTLMLLTVTVQFYRAFEAEYGRGPGFRTDGMVLMNLNPGLARYDERQTETFYRLLEERTAAIPGVTSTGLTSFVPLSQEGVDRAAIVPEGYDLPPRVDSLTVSAARIDDGYLDTIGIPIVRGRGFSSADTADAPRVAIVNRGMAARYWPGQDPIGKRMRIGGPNNPWVEIVGVAADAKFRLFTPASTDFLYLPRLQQPAARSTLLVAVAGDPAAVATALRKAVTDTDPNVPILAMRTMQDYYHASARNLNNVTVRTVGGMGMMGLALAMIGLYGLVAYASGRKTREIGIRMALGALPSSVLRMILRLGWVPAICGVVAGAAASAAAGRLVNAAFPGTAIDAVTYVLVVPALIAMIMIAAYVPARRAARVNPVVALRAE